MNVYGATAAAQQPVAGDVGAGGRPPRMNHGVMCTCRFVPLLVVAVLLSMGCHSSSRVRPEPMIQSTLITVDQLPTTFDQTRTYHYEANRVDKPEDLIRSLWDAGIFTRFAWAPLDDRCLNPIGPRFTVELVRDTPRIADFGFARGEDFLRCAAMLMAYDVTEGGS